uniref:Fibrinogen C-terminal domain-containing protein n=1 Tax=Amphimedon queenslandica TaxID=400682 RepID=A0A1X7U140_AMPQE
MNNINYEAQGPPDVSRPHSNEDNHYYDLLDHSQRSATKEANLQVKYQQKPIPIILVIALLCLIAATVVALLGMKGYSLYTSKSSLKFAQTMETVTQNLSQMLSHYESRGSNNSATCRQVLGISKKSIKKLINITNTLSEHANSSASIATIVDDILLVVKELLDVEYKSYPPTSCKEAKERNPRSQSGEYLLRSANGISAIRAYCYMEELCGSGGGWTRIAYLNMTDPTQSCPSGFRLYQSGGVRTCGRPESKNGTCVSIEFPSNGIRYSQICGRVVGYQFATTNGFNIKYNTSTYVDGVSITRGSSYQHVWSFAAGLLGYYREQKLRSICPCSNGSINEIPSFVGSHYFCESGRNIKVNTSSDDRLYTSDPLWDGQGCGPNEVLCCSAPGIPWFHRDYDNNTTTDYIELRVCCNQGTGNEDVPVELYEMYVK